MLDTIQQGGWLRVKTEGSTPQYLRVRAQLLLHTSVLWCQQSREDVVVWRAFPLFYPRSCSVRLKLCIAVMCSRSDPTGKWALLSHSDWNGCSMGSFPDKALGKTTFVRIQLTKTTHSSFTSLLSITAKRKALCLDLSLWGIPVLVSKADFSKAC